MVGDGSSHDTLDFLDFNMLLLASKILKCYLNLSDLHPPPANI